MLSQTDIEKLKQIADILKHCRSLLAVTGAGISAESGVPTYRGIGGLYNRGTTEEGLPIEMILSGFMMVKNPEITWKYLADMEKTCRAAQFNQAHRVLANFDKRFERVVILTQNVDGFHKQAGSRDVIDIHGDFRSLYCMKRSCTYREEVNSYSHLTIPPECPACGSLVRPDVVLFGEILPTAKVKRIRQELAKGFDIIFTIGTTSVFPYITMPVEIGKQRGIPTVEINPSTTEVSSVVDYKISAKAGEALLTLEKFLDA